MNLTARRLTAIAVIIFSFININSQTQQKRLPSTQFADKHIFCQSGDNYTEVSYHIEMPNDSEWQPIVLKKVFDNAASNLEQSIELFVSNYGTPVETLPYTHKNHTPVEAVTCTIEDYTGDFITFFIYKEHIPSTISMKPTTQETSFITLDLNRNCLLTKSNVFDMKKCKGAKAMQELRSHFTVNDQFAAAFNSFDVAKFEGSLAVTDGHFLTLMFTDKEDNSKSYNATANIYDIFNFLSADMKRYHPENGTAPEAKKQKNSENSTSNATPQTSEERITEVPDKMPEFGGNINQWLSINLRYPDIDEQLNVEGKCVVQFVVEVDGSISNVNIVKHVSPTIDRESARVVMNMPRWIPGTVDGKPTRCRFVLPINFKLQEQVQE